MWLVLGGGVDATRVPERSVGGVPDGLSLRVVKSGALDLSDAQRRRELLELVRVNCEQTRSM
jgi:hypothetical protein